jgi:predicted 3-demethylubiquinone-9 3-methyltransferase (glyoxalase superfamily)
VAGRVTTHHHGRFTMQRRCERGDDVTEPLTTCLWFVDEAEDAARFYTSVFDDGRILTVTRHGDAGSEEAGSVMTVEFEVHGSRFVALNGAATLAFTEAVSFQVFCDDQDEVDRYWERLTDGGQEGRSGWLTDRYGVSWQIIPSRLMDVLQDPDPDAAARATAAMLAMRKLDLPALEAAAAGDA